MFLGLTAVAFEPVYAAAKHGVVGLSRSLAVRQLQIDSINIEIGLLKSTLLKARINVAFKHKVNGICVVLITIIIKVFKFYML